MVDGCQGIDDVTSAAAGGQDYRVEKLPREVLTLAPEARLRGDGRLATAVSCCVIAEWTF